MENQDVIIVGAGIGGLVAGALLAENGVKVLLLEQAVNVGGCAATFSHRGYRFDAGATIGCGFHPGGPMNWLAEKLDVSWPARPLRVAWEYCDGERCIPLDSAGNGVLQTFPESRQFWREQAELAASFWEVTACLLSLYNQTRMRQAVSLGACLIPKMMGVRLMRLASMSVRQWLQRHGLAENRAFCRFLDAQLLISAQTTSSRCNAFFAALALDLPARSPCALDRGIGTIADILSQAIGRKGGRIHLVEKVQSLTVQGEKISEVVTDWGRYRGKEVIVNGSDAMLAQLLFRSVPHSWANDARAAWGAFILHLGVDQKTMADRAGDHLQLLRPESTALAEGSSLFLSASPLADESRAPGGKRALSLSTHTAVAPWWQAWTQGHDVYRRLKAEYTEKVLEVAETYVPGLRQGIDFCLAGTPVTYARYTGRHLGLVGGYTQTRLLAPRQKRYGLKNCILVGDHCFPGQSIAGVTVGAAIVVDGLLRRLA